MSAQQVRHNATAEPTFGAELRRLRRDALMSGRDLADAASVSPQYANDLEHDRRAPHRGIVERLLGAMALTPDEEQHLRELAFRARGECCPKCGFGSEDEA